MKEKEATAKLLANSHYDADPDTKIIYYFPGGESIHLLEIIEPKNYTGEIIPFTFLEDRKEKIHYRSTIILVNQKEFEEIQEGKIKLPEMWELEKKICIDKKHETNEGQK